MNRNEEINRLRALAVVATVYAHISDLWLWEIKVLSIFKKCFFGSDGVMLFFVISGFLISGSLLPKLDLALLKGKVSNVVTAFFCKRLYRITPTAITWIFILLIITLRTNPELARGNIYAGIASLFNFFNIYAVFCNPLPNLYGVYWSLSLEEQFYIVLPLAFILIRLNYHRITFLLVLMLITHLNFKAIAAFPIPPIVCGVILYLLDRKLKLVESFKKTKFSDRKYLLPIVLILITLLFSFRFILLKIGCGERFYSLIVSPFYTALFFLALLEKNLILPLPSSFWNKMLAWLGSRSFTLYLSHLPMIFLVRHCWMVFGSSFGVSYTSKYTLLIGLTWLIVTVLATEISYRLLEKPLMQKGRRIAGLIESNKMSFSGAVYRPIFKRRIVSQ